MFKRHGFKNVLVGSLLLAHSAFVYAACDPNLCSARVKTLYAHSNGKVYLEMHGDMSQLNCTLDQGSFIVLKDNHARHEEIYSMLLAAQLANQEVVVRILNNSSDCQLVYSILTVS